jgi:ribonuclease P protein component
VVLLQPGRGEAGARLGLAISKRMAPRAVDRNRIRRIIRETFRKRWDLLPGVDMVFLIRNRPRDLSSAALHAELSRLWTRVETRCNAWSCS